MKGLIVLFSLIMSGATFARDGISTKDYQNNAKVLANLLDSKKTPTVAKTLLKSIVEGQTHVQRVSVICVYGDAASGHLFHTFRLGVDDLRVGGTGWDKVIDVTAEYMRDARGLFYDLYSVKSSSVTVQTAEQECEELQ